MKFAAFSIALVSSQLASVVQGVEYDNPTNEAGENCISLEVLPPEQVAASPPSCENAEGKSCFDLNYRALLKNHCEAPMSVMWRWQMQSVELRGITIEPGAEKVIGCYKNQEKCTGRIRVSWGEDRAGETREQ